MKLFRCTAKYGNVECLEYLCNISHEYYWHPKTTRCAALCGQITCLKYIFENNIIAWEDANLQNDFGKFPKESQEFINLVRDDWKFLGQNIKG